MANAPDVAVFAALITSARMNTPAPDLGDEIRRGPRWTPIIAILVAFAVVLGVGWVGITMIGFGSSSKPSANASLDAAVLTEQTRASAAASSAPTDLAIVAARSFDPYGDDNGDGKDDRRKGRENQDVAASAIDGSTDTGWRTDKYSTANLDGKPGVGLIVDLGSPQSIRSLSLAFDGAGTDAQVRISNSIQADPSLWTQMASVQAAGEQLQIRSPRPITGRYVLVWMTRLPSSGSGYRGGIKEIGVRS
jgi:putative peptidoglycan lipid II flippase